MTPAFIQIAKQPDWVLQYPGSEDPVLIDILSTALTTVVRDTATSDRLQSYQLTWTVTIGGPPKFVTPDPDLFVLMSSRGVDIYGFSITSGPDLATAIQKFADGLQDWAITSRIQWPLWQEKLLTPRVIDGAAVWTSGGRTIVSVGALNKLPPGGSD